MECEINDADGCDKLLIKPTGQVKKPRTYYSYSSRGPRWDIPNNDIHTVRHAVLERVFFTKGNSGFRRAPKPWDQENWPEEPCVKARRLLAEMHVASRTNQFADQLVRLIESEGPVSPLSDQEFLAHYGGAKRKIYAAAIESLKERDLNRKDCEVKCFTKDEYRKPGGAPRAIQPRSPRYNVKFGRYIKHVEHKVFEAIDKVFDSTGSHKTVAKGMNMAERGRAINQMWTSFQNPVAIGLDASRFDQHINTALLEIEHGIYKRVCGKSPDLPSLRKLLQAQKLNKGVYKAIDGILEYLVEGNRMSGDMNTSLGNVIIMCCLMYCYLEEKGLLKSALLLNDGDDCVLIMDARNVDKFRTGLESWFLRMGITMQYDGVYHTLETIEFCQSRPVRVNGSYVLVPRPSKRLYSDLFTTKPINSKKIYNKMLGAKGECGLAMSGGVPIFQSFYSWFCRSAKPWRPEVGSYYYHYRQDLSDGMVAERVDISMDTRISFYFAFDITPEEQLAMEKYYDEKQSLVYSSPIKEYSLRLDIPQYLVEPEQTGSDVPGLGYQ